MDVPTRCIPDGYTCRYRLLWQDFVKHRNVLHSAVKFSPELGTHRLYQILNFHDVSSSGQFSRFIDALLPKVLAQENVSPPYEPIRKMPKLLITDEEIEKYMDNETGMDRLKKMFTRVKADEFSPELTLTIQTVQCSALISFVIFSYIGGFHAKEKFVEENKHVKFLSKFRAARAYNDAILLGGIKFGATWALKSAFFLSTFLLVSQTIPTYRNKSTPCEYLFAGALTGGLARLNFGLRGLIAGSIIGGFLGGVGGILIYGGMKLSNETQEQRHYWAVHDEIRRKKEGAFLQGDLPPVEGDLPPVPSSTQETITS